MMKIRHNTPFFKASLLALFVCCTATHQLSGMKQGEQHVRQGDDERELLHSSGETVCGSMPCIRIMKRIPNKEGERGQTVDISPFYTKYKDLDFIALAKKGSKNQKGSPEAFGGAIPCLGLIFTSGACSSHKYYSQLHQVIAGECDVLDDEELTGNVAILCDDGFGWSQSGKRQVPMKGISVFEVQRVFEKFVYCCIRKMPFCETNFKEFKNILHYRTYFEGVRKRYFELLPEKANEKLGEVLVNLTVFIGFTRGLEIQFGLATNFAEAMYKDYTTRAQRGGEMAFHVLHWIGFVMKGIQALRDAYLFTAICIAQKGGKARKLFVVIPYSAYGQSKSRIALMLRGNGYRQRFIRQNIVSNKTHFFVPQGEDYQDRTFWFREGYLEQGVDNGVEVFFKQDVRCFFSEVMFDYHSNYVNEHCSACGKKGNNLKQCSRCKAVRYCGAACQRSGWKKHKKNCSFLSKLSRPVIVCALNCCFECSATFLELDDISAHCIRFGHGMCKSDGSPLSMNEAFPDKVAFFCWSCDREIETFEELQGHCMGLGHEGVIRIYNDGEFDKKDQKKNHKKK